MENELNTVTKGFGYSLKISKKESPFSHVSTTDNEFYDNFHETKNLDLKSNGFENFQAILFPRTEDFSYNSNIHNYQLEDGIQKLFYKEESKYLNKEDFEQVILSQKSSEENVEKFNSEMISYLIKFLSNTKICEITNELYQTLKGKFFYLIKNQGFSRAIQKAFKKTNPDILGEIFREINNKLNNLIIDIYGNYFCQNLFPFLCLDERISFLRELKLNFVETSIHSTGTFAMQSIIEQLITSEEKQVIIEVTKSKKVLQSLSMNNNGCHVLGKIIMLIPEENIPFVYQHSFDNFISLSYNPNGICIIKKIITYSRKQSTIEKIKKILTDNFLYLIQNCYANYSIQTAIEVN
jgi:hypothetical protein